MWTGTDLFFQGFSLRDWEGRERGFYFAGKEAQNRLICGSMGFRPARSYLCKCLPGTPHQRSGVEISRTQTADLKKIGYAFGPFLVHLYKENNMFRERRNYESLIPFPISSPFLKGFSGKFWVDLFNLVSTY